MTMTRVQRGWKATWLQVQEKLRRDEPLTMPEARWLAWELPRLIEAQQKDDDGARLLIFRLKRAETGAITTDELRSVLREARIALESKGQDR